MATVVQMKMRSNRSLSEIANVLRYAVVEFDDFKLVCYQQRNHSVFLCFERYYMSIKRYASLSIMLSDEGETLTADLVGLGVGEGPFNLSWGANSAIVQKTVKQLEEIGFRKIIE